LPAVSGQPIPEGAEPELPMAEMDEVPAAPPPTAMPDWRAAPPPPQRPIIAPPIQGEPPRVEPRTENSPPPPPVERLPEVPDWRASPPPPRNAAAPSSEAPPRQEPPRRRQPPSIVQVREVEEVSKEPQTEKQPPRRKSKPRSEVPVGQAYRPPPAPEPPAPEAPPREPPAPQKHEPVQQPADGPVELPAGVWEPPPIRRGPGAEVAGSTGTTTLQAPAAKRRRARWLLILIAGGVPVIIAVAVAFAWHRYHTRESRYRDEARRLYDEGKYSQAQGRYEELHDNFPGANSDEYSFMADLCNLRSEEHSVSPDPMEALEIARTFLKNHTHDELLQNFAGDVGMAVVTIIKEQVIKPDSAGGKDQAVVKAAEEIVNLLKAALPDAISGTEGRQLADGFDAARKRAEIAKKVDDALNRGNKLPQNMKGIKEWRKEMEADYLKDNPDAQALLKKLEQGHKDSIKYTVVAAPPPRRVEDKDVSLVVDPLVGGHSWEAKDDDDIVLALVRGVLYALRQSDGEVRWALRVGIDTSELPVRVPRTPVNPELFLVLSADTATLTAFDAAGQPVWRYRLSAPSLGRPVIVDRAAYVPTADGLVHEVELAKGKLVGQYNLGLPLRVGGVRQGDTKLVYFAADDSCVFVLDVDKHECQTVLYTNHLAGSLRGEPVISTWTEPDINGKPVPLGYLFLSLADGPDAVHVQTYSLPLQDAHAVPLMKPELEPRLDGWTWFPPHLDAEKLVMVSDAGMLGLFGIKQFHNDDHPLFPMVMPDPKRKGHGIDLDPFLKFDTRDRGRAQVAHAAEENNFWILAHGKLNRLKLLLNPAVGPKVFPGWTNGALPLGSPLHASQVYEYAFDKGPRSTTLMLVTQTLTRQSCLATAVDAETGEIRWQRQLGLVSSGEPILLGQDVLTLDQGGGLFSFNSARFQQRFSEWPVGGQSLAGSLEDGEGPPPFLLRGPDGASAYEIACPAKGGQLVVRRVYAREEGRKPRAVEFALKKDLIGKGVTLGGTPAVGAGGLLIPLSDGTSLRLTLNGADPDDGPNWRGNRKDPELRTHVVWLNDDEFLTTDGGRGINRWHWPAGQSWEKVPAGLKEQPTFELKDASIASVPLVIRPDKDRPEAAVCVADAAGVLWMLKANDLATANKTGVGMEIAQRWDLGGKITAGPFFIGKDIGCIVDRRRLVRIDVAKPKPVWEHESKEAIVGQPQQIEDLLVVADQSGLYLGLNPQTGRPRAPGYRLRASVAPAASPVAFGRRQAFAPLTDGTVLLLSLDPLRNPLWGVPGFW
jgi:hypothetical protein